MADPTPEQVKIGERVYVANLYSEILTNFDDVPNKFIQTRKSEIFGNIVEIYDLERKLFVIKYDPVKANLTSRRTVNITSRAVHHYFELAFPAYSPEKCISPKMHKLLKWVLN